jgi:Caenorhabditis protein of unknown function, DUF268
MNKKLKIIKSKTSLVFDVIFRFPVKFFKRCSLLIKEQFGLDFEKLFFAIASIFRYIHGYCNFRMTCASKVTISPCLTDYLSTAGDVTSEYFVNDLFVAQMIFDNKPQKHVDIGSRLDGFVAHIASYREVEVFDIRPLSCRSKNIRFNQMDMMKPPSRRYWDYADSISCIHALEHFGLGRYGDPIDAGGFHTGLKNIMKLLKVNGLLYLSIPLGKDRVEFNSHRITNPLNLLRFTESCGFDLEGFYYLKDGVMQEAKDIETIFKKISLERYVLGTFVMRRSSPEVREK